MSNSGHPKDQGQRRGLMLVISSPSGAGKTTLARKLMEEFSDIKLSVSATTREPRPGETDGIDYHFKTREDFREMIARREFLEWALVFDNLYGTPRADTERLLEQRRAEAGRRIRIIIIIVLVALIGLAIYFWPAVRVADDRLGGLVEAEGLDARADLGGRRREGALHDLRRLADARDVGVGLDLDAPDGH